MGRSAPHAGDERASVFVNGEATAMMMGRGGVGDGDNDGAGETLEIFPGGLSPCPTAKEGSGDFDGRDDDDGDCASFGGNDGGACGDWDDDQEGAGFQLRNDTGDGPTMAEADEGREERSDEVDAAAAASLLRGNTADEGTVAASKEKVKKAPQRDPWALLDPHNEPSNDSMARPLRVGVIVRLPPYLDEDDHPSSAVNGSSTRTKKAGSKKKKNEKKKEGSSRVAPSAAAASKLMKDLFDPPYLTRDVTFDEDDVVGDGGDDDDADRSMDETGASTNDRPRLDDGAAPPHQLDVLRKLQRKELIFGEEFAYVARAHAKHRAATRRQEQRQQLESQGGQRQGEPNKEAQAVDDANAAFDEDDNDDYGGGFDFGGGDDGSFGNPPGNEDDGNNERLHRSNVDFDAIDDVFGGGDHGGGGGFNDDDGEFNGNGPAHHRTFEELCRAHLRKFARSAESYAAETHLTRRVGAWQDGLAPLLEEQECRPEFDIHDCGRRILETVEQTSVFDDRLN